MTELPARFARTAPDELHEYCAATAVHLLREREAHYPRAVEARKMTAEASAEGLELMRCIVAQWRWVMDPARPPLPKFDTAAGYFGAHAHILAAEMDRVAARARQLAARDPVDWAKEEMADLCDALAWYQQRIGSDARVITHHVRRGETDALAA